MVLLHAPRPRPSPPTSLQVIRGTTPPAPASSLTSPLLHPPSHLHLWWDRFNPPSLIVLSRSLRTLPADQPRPDEATARARCGERSSARLGSPLSARRLASVRLAANLPPPGFAIQLLPRCEWEIHQSRSGWEPLRGDPETTEPDR